MSISVRLIAVVRFRDKREAQDIAAARGYMSTDSLLQFYEYLMPDGCDGSENFGVVSPSAKIGSIGGMKIVRIVSTKPLVDQQYDGDLKPLVAAFSTKGFAEWNERLAKKKSLMAQIEKKISERSKIAQLESLASDDPDARALLYALKDLG